MVSKKKRRRRKRIKNWVLRFAAYLNGCVFLISACAIDSDSWVPFFVCFVSMLYLFLFGMANGWFDEEEVNDCGTDDLYEKRETGTDKYSL